MSGSTVLKRKDKVTIVVSEFWTIHKESRSYYLLYKISASQKESFLTYCIGISYRLFVHIYMYSIAEKFWSTFYISSKHRKTNKSINIKQMSKYTLQCDQIVCVEYSF